MTRCSSSPEQKEGEERGLEREKDPPEGQMINKVATAVMKKLADSDPSKILTPDHMNRIKQCLSEVYPVFRPPNHPTYAVMILTAIDELDEEGGSTQESISKFIRERFDCLPLAHESLLGHHLKKLSDSREIVSASKNCDMLPAEKKYSVSRREQEQYTKEIDDQNGCSEQQTEQQDEVNGQQSGTQMQEVAVIVEKQNNASQMYKVTAEHFEVGEQYTKVVDDQNGCSEQQTEQHDEVNGQQSQTQMQEIAMNVENQNNAIPVYKLTAEHFEVSECQRLHGQQSQEPGPQEQHRKVVDDQIRFSDELDELNAQQSKNQMEEVAVTLEKQKSKAAEVTEQRREHWHYNQDLSLEEHHKMVIDSQVGPSDEQKDEVNGGKGKTQIQESLVIVETQSAAEHKYKVTEDQVVVTVQRREAGQQSSQREEHNKMIDYQNRSPEHQSEQSKESNGQQSKKQMQETAVVENQINAEHNNKAAEENFEAREDEIGEEQYQTKDQQCEVAREQLQIEGIENEIQLLEEQVEILEKQTEPKQQIEMISEQNEPEEQIESISKIIDSGNMQELLSRKHEKDAAIVPNSSPSLMYQLLPHHGSSFLSEFDQQENCVELLMRTRKLEVKLLANLSSIRERSNKSSQKPELQPIEVSSSLALPTEQQAENVIRETSVEIELAVSEQSCKKQQVKQEYQNQRQLRPRHKKPSESGCRVPKPTKFQKLELEKLPENQIEESLVELGTEAPDQSCQTPHKALGQQQKRQLRPRGKKSHSGSQKELEHDQQPREQLHKIGMTLDPIPTKLSCQAQKNTQEPAQRRQLRPRGERLSISEVSITTSTAESPPTRHQATLLSNLQEAEKPQELKISAEKTGQTQQWRQLRPRVKKLSESGEAPTGSGVGLSPSQSLELSNSGRSQLGKLGERQSKSEVSVTTSMLESPPTRNQLPDLQEAEKPQELKTSAVKGGQTQHQRQLRPRVKKPSESGQSSSGCRAVFSSSGRSQMQKLGVEDSSQVKNLNKNHYNLRKRCTPESTTMDGLSEPIEQKLNNQGQQKTLKSRPTTTEVPDELAPSAMAKLSVKIKELQWQRHMTLRSHEQGVSQSDPSASMTESSPSQDQCEKPEEKEHRDELQQKQKRPRRPKKNFETTLVNTDISKDGASAPRHKAGVLLLLSTDQQPEKQGRGRPCKGKLAAVATSDVSLPDHSQKQLEQPEKRRRGRPGKEKLATAASNNVSLPNNFQKQLEPPKNRKRGRPSNFGAEITLSKIKLTSKKQKQEK